MLRGYTITYVTDPYNSHHEYTSFFHAYGKYSWFPYQIKQQSIGHLVVPIRIKKSCLYDIRDLIGPPGGKGNYYVNKT